MAIEQKLTARLEPFDSFWEGPEDVEKGYKRFGQFYRVNYLPHVPADKNANILVISCGPGYFVNLLNEAGYANVLGIDSFPDKIEHAQNKGLNCQTAVAFPFLAETTEQFDVVICEQELNHLTKDEMVAFLNLCRDKMSDNGALIVHGLNGANPITGAEALAQNFDHFNTFTDYSLRQVLTYCGFERVNVFPLNLYVFYTNPFNYVAWLVAGLLSLIFRFGFVLYGKKNKIFTKKIAAVGYKKR
ncbi:MAG: class I SAM-dependent methyltransferase [Chloroflexi bacterium]|nr:class I SAM-dependent methyltransferase [Chloroflexota bacterium]